MIPSRVMSIVVHTIGHSNRTQDELIELLSAHAIDLLVDVRTIPRSRHNPQFNADELARALPARGVRYLPEKALGGLRKPAPASPNGGWENESFRGYADHMQTDAFARALDALIARAARDRVAIMCAEAVPFRCHRSLIADALVARGVEVRHIMTAHRADPHRLTSFARVEGTRVTYPPAQPDLFPAR